MKKFIEVTEILFYSTKDDEMKGYFRDSYGKKKSGKIIEFEVITFDYKKILINIDTIQNIEEDSRYFSAEKGNYLVKINSADFRCYVKESFEEIKKMIDNITENDTL